jgi:tetratricopeptide (TPR) repeat protein
MSALEKFEEAKNRYQSLGKQSELNQVNALISQCNEMRRAYEIFENAKIEFVNRNFLTAKQQFEDLLFLYSTILEEDTVRECNQYIEVCGEYIRAQEREQQAETDIQAERWDSAISNLQEAGDIYLEMGENDKVSWIEERIKEVQRDSKEKDLESQLQKFIMGTVIIIGGLVLAFLGYNTFRRTSEPDTLSIGSLLESPDVPIEIRKFLEEKIGWKNAMKSDSHVEICEIMKKLQDGKVTLEKMFSEGHISEKEYTISVEEIERKIGKFKDRID